MSDANNVISSRPPEQPDLINQLPDEILLSILEFAATVVEEPVVESWHAWIRSLRLVCVRWEKIIIDVTGLTMEIPIEIRICKNKTIDISTSLWFPKTYHSFEEFRTKRDFNEKLWLVNLSIISQQTMLTLWHIEKIMEIAKLFDTIKSVDMDCVVPRVLKWDLEALCHTLKSPIELRYFTLRTRQFDEKLYLALKEYLESHNRITGVVIDVAFSTDWFLSLESFTVEQISRMTDGEHEVQNQHSSTIISYHESTRSYMTMRQHCHVGGGACRLSSFM